MCRSGSQRLDRGDPLKALITAGIGRDLSKYARERGASARDGSTIDALGRFWRSVGCI